MIIDDQPNIVGLRFWYYALPINVTGKARREAIGKIQSALFKPSRYGIKTRDEAEQAARQIEDATGVELEIGRHDFL